MAAAAAAAAGAGAGAGAGRARPRYAVSDSDSAPILPLLVSPNLNLNSNSNPTRTRAEDMDTDKASADIRKLVKYWRAYVTQLRRFNATFPAVLTVGPHSHSHGNGNGNGSLSGATPRSVTSRYKTTPRAGPRSDRCKSVPTTARAELAGADHAAGEGAAQIQIPMDLDAIAVERLAEGLKWAAGPLKTAFAAVLPCCSYCTYDVSHPPSPALLSCDRPSRTCGRRF